MEWNTLPTVEGYCVAYFKTGRNSFHSDRRNCGDKERHEHEDSCCQLGSGEHMTTTYRDKHYGEDRRIWWHVYANLHYDCERIKTAKCNSQLMYWIGRAIVGLDTFVVYAKPVVSVCIINKPFGWTDICKKVYSNLWFVLNEFNGARNGF